MKCKASLINRKEKYKDEEITIAQTHGEREKISQMLRRTVSLFKKKYLNIDAITYYKLSISSIFSRAEISADGNYAVCGGSSKFNKLTYSLRFWESSTGHTVPSALSEIEFPYPIRSVAWHPRQHMLAVSMVGQGAAVVIYCAERDTSDKMVTKKVNAAIVEIANLKKDKEVPPTAESSKENIEQKNEAKVSM